MAVEALKDPIELLKLLSTPMFEQAKSFVVIQFPDASFKEGKTLEHCIHLKKKKTRLETQFVQILKVKLFYDQHG